MNNRNCRLTWWFPVFTLIFLSLGTKARLPDENRYHAHFQNDTLTCLIMPQEVYRKQQYPAGYHYRILQEFVQYQNSALHIVRLPDSISVWEALRNNMVRIVVLDAARDTIPKDIEDLAIVGLSLNAKEHIWVYPKEDFELMKVMYTWFNSFKHTSIYAEIAHRFYLDSERYGTPAGRALSPYDDLIRRYSQTIGWDWRLLASLIFQESNFRMNITSPRGAIGLMQVMPGTAQNFGIEPTSRLYDPEENIRAGTLLLKKLSHLIGDTPPNRHEEVPFILAAYNAGYEQIKDCRSFAAIKGKNPNIWSEVVEVIPLMRERENAHLVKRCFKGDETVRFVEEVLARYERYCKSDVAQAVR